MKFRGFVAVTAAALALVCGSSQAVAACWSPAAIEAAQMRDFEVMLMVATLRCQIKGVDLSGDYNQFIRGKRTVLVGVNDELRANFAPGVSANAALDAYDRFATSLANAYGSGTRDMGCSDYKALMDAANAIPASRAALLDLAVRAGADPIRASERCAARLAMAH